MNAGIGARTGAGASADANSGAGAGTDARIGARTGASASADAGVGTRGGIGPGEDAGTRTRARTGAGVGEGKGAGSANAESWIGWADAGLDVSEMMVVESSEDDDKLEQDIPKEEVVTADEVDWAGAGGANTVTRRPECCVDGGGAERGQTAGTALLTYD